jgi:hypothetical protein
MKREDERMMYKMPERAHRQAGFAITLIALVLLLIWPAGARVRKAVADAAPLACACCADEGEWYERQEGVSSAQLSELSRLRFSQTANTFETPADEGDLASTYSLSQRNNGRRWELRFRDEQGKSGTLTFMLPATAVSFGTDLHDAPPGGVGPTLYKEWRFSGTAQVTGIFKKGVSGAKRFRLILQGRGNRCEQMEDFKHWTLQISGGRVTYAFYGSLNNPG